MEGIQQQLRQELAAAIPVEVRNAVAQANNPANILGMLGQVFAAGGPPSFNGTSDESVTDWMEDFDGFARRYNLTDQNKIEYLRVATQGAARTAYRDIAERAPDPPTWAFYQEEFRTRFPENRAAPIREMEFQQRRQREGETPDAFAEDLRRLAAKAFRTLGDAERQQRVKWQFLQGLGSPELKQMVACVEKEDPTIDDYVRRANLLQMWKPGGALTPGESKHWGADELIKTITALASLGLLGRTGEEMASKKSVWERLGNPTTTAMPEQRGCRYCREHRFPSNNHTDETCWRQQTCQLCEHIGHIAKHCPDSGTGTSKVAKRPPQQQPPIQRGPVGYASQPYQQNPQFQPYPQNQPSQPYQHNPPIQPYQQNQPFQQYQQNLTYKQYQQQPQFQPYQQQPLYQSYQPQHQLVAPCPVQRDNNCRKCGQPGHFARDCGRNVTNKPTGNSLAVVPPQPGPQEVGNHEHWQPFPPENVPIAYSIVQPRKVLLPIPTTTNVDKTPRQNGPVSGRDKAGQRGVKRKRNRIAKAKRTKFSRRIFVDHKTGTDSSVVSTGGIAQDGETKDVVYVGFDKAAKATKANKNDSDTKWDEGRQEEAWIEFGSPTTTDDVAEQEEELTNGEGEGTDMGMDEDAEEAQHVDTNECQQDERVVVKKDEGPKWTALDTIQTPEKPKRPAPPPFSGKVFPRRVANLLNAIHSWLEPDGTIGMPENADYISQALGELAFEQTGQGPPPRMLADIASQNQGIYGYVAAQSDRLYRQWAENDNKRSKRKLVATKDGDSRSKGGYVNLGSLALTLAIVISMLCWVPAVSAQMENYYLCGGSKSGTAMSVPRQVTCVGPREMTEPILTVDTEIWVNREHPLQTEAAKCTWHRHTVCSTVGFLGGRTERLNAFQVDATDFTECELAWRYKQIRGQALKQLTDGVWGTNTSMDIGSTWCCKELCQTIDNFVLELGMVATFDGRNVFSDLEDMAGCPAAGVNCTTTHSTIVWHPDVFAHFCHLEHKFNGSAQINERFLIVDSLQAALTYDKRTTECNIPDMHRTAQGIYLKSAALTNAMARTFGRGISRRKRQDVTTDTQDAGNPKLQYLELKILEIEQANFRQVWSELCTLASRQLQMIWQLLRLEPTVGARALLQRQDIHASFAGEALLIWQCKAIAVNKTSQIHWTYMVNDTCYAELPIDVDGDLYFVIPGTQELTKQSTVIPCGNHITGRFWDGKEWRTASGPAVVSQYPIEVVWKNHTQPFTFDKPALFHDRLNGIEGSVQMLRHYVSRTMRIEEKLDRVTKYAASFSWNPDTVYQTLSGAGNGIGKALVGAGEGIAKMFGGISKSGTESINSLLSGPLHSLITAAIVLGVLALIGLGIWMTFRYWRPRLCNRAKDTTPLAGRLEEVIQTNHREPTAPALPVANDYHQWKGPKHPTIADLLVQKREEQLKQMYPALHWQSTKQPPTSYSQSVDDLYRVLSVQRDKAQTPWSVITINGKPDAMGLWDTGSCATLLSHNTYKYMQKEGIAYPIFAKARGPLAANGEEIPIIGMTILDIEVQGHKETITALVAEGLVVPLILGTDFLYRFPQANFDFNNKQLRLGNDLKIPLNGVNPPMEGELARANTNYEIPALHKQIVTLAVLAKDGSTVMFEPSADYRTGTLRLARSVCTVNNGHIMAEAINLGRTPATLYAKCRTGVITELPEPGVVLTIFESDSDQKKVVSAANKQEIQKLDTPHAEARAWLAETVKWEDTDASTEEKAALLDILGRFPWLYARSKNDVGFCPLVTHEIDTGNHPPFRQPPHRLPPALREEVEQQISEQLERGLIEVSDSEYASPIVVVPKKDGTFRICCDYRKLNSQTKFSPYPMPRMEELLDAVGGAKWFSSLDQAWGYLQVPMSDDAKRKAAFITHTGHYQPTRMTFGLSGAPGTYQSMMDLILAGCQFRTCLTYLDDCLIFGRNIQEHNERLENILGKLYDAGLKLRPEKCHFLRRKVIWLGHLLSGDGIRPDPDKISALQRTKAPTNVSELRSWIGLPVYYKKFIKGFSSLARPLHKLLAKDVPFEWGQEQDAAFHEITKRLVQAPILAHPDFTKPWVLQTDGSGDGVGCVLSQIQPDGKDHPVAYYARSLNKHERKYSAWEIEGLSIINGLEHFRTLLYGQPVTVVTDNQSLGGIFQKQHTNPRLARWGILAQQYKLTFVYRPGAQNNADALSRPPICNANDDNTMDVQATLLTQTDTISYLWSALQNAHNFVLTHMSEAITNKQNKSQETTESMQQANDSQQQSAWPETVIPTNLTSIVADLPEILAPILDWQTWMSAQRADVTLASIIKQLSLNTNKGTERDFVLSKGLLYHSASANKRRLCVPVSLVPAVLRLYHDSPLCGHMAEARTSARIATVYFWPTMRRDIAEYCKSCLECAKQKPPHQHIKAPLSPITPPSEPWKHIAVDIKGPITSTKRGNRFTISFIDYLTRAVESVAVPNTTADTLSKALMELVILRHGPPEQLLSDNGANLRSSTFQNVCSIFSIKRVFTSAYHAATDGLVERWHRTLGTMLRIYSRSHQIMWDDLLPYTVFAHNTAVNASSKYTPFELLYGRKPRNFIAFEQPQKPNAYRIDLDLYAETVRSLMTEAHKLARANIIQAQERQRGQYDKHVNMHNYRPGDKLFVKNQCAKMGLSKSLQNRWIGPRTVVDVRGPTVQVNQRSRSTKRLVWIHINRTKPAPPPRPRHLRQIAIGSNSTKPMTTLDLKKPDHNEDQKQADKRRPRQSRRPPTTSGQPKYNLRPRRRTPGHLDGALV